MNYLGLLERHARKENRQKTLLVRATGRFYTPEVIGRDLAKTIIRTIGNRSRPALRVIDPFAGDGRLICWLMEEYARSGNREPERWVIDLWDCDDVALLHARSAIRSVANALGLRYTVRSFPEDSFKKALRARSAYDVVVTNPPWEVLKPDPRDLKGMSPGAASKYVVGLKEWDCFLGAHYPYSQPQRKFSGWGTNLARCGTELALKLTADGGACGIVSPASLLADTVSTPLREWLFTTYALHDLAVYPAEAKLFNGVDQPVVTLTVSPGSNATRPVSLRLFNNAATSGRAENVKIGRPAVFAKHGLPLLLGSGPLKLLRRLNGLPTFGALEGRAQGSLWAGRELDETRHASYLTAKGVHPFVKGRMVTRFGMTEMPTRFVRQNARRIPPSVQYIRIAWRDVSRPNQRRRIQAALIPAGWISGNSLNVAYFRDSDENRLKALLALLNSFVFEYQVRAYLATAHVSLTTVRKARLPILDDRTVSILAPMVTGLIDGDSVLEADIEVRAAQLFGLTTDEFGMVLSSFGKITLDERENLLSSSLWRESV